MRDDLLIVHDFQGSLVFWLGVHGAEHPFDSTGHFPVLAGYDTSGREIFVARAFLSDNGRAGYSYSYVCDGARSMSIIGEDGKRRTTSQFYVLVLRHDPCDVRMKIPGGRKVPNRTSVLDAQG